MTIPRKEDGTPDFGSWETGWPKKYITGEETQAIAKVYYNAGLEDAAKLMETTSIKGSTSGFPELGECDIAPGLNLEGRLRAAAIREKMDD